MINLSLDSPFYVPLLVILLHSWFLLEVESAWEVTSHRGMKALIQFGSIFWRPGCISFTKGISIEKNKAERKILRERAGMPLVSLPSIGTKYILFDAPNQELTLIFLFPLKAEAKERMLAKQ